MVVVAEEKEKEKVTERKQKINGGKNLKGGFK